MHAIQKTILTDEDGQPIGVLIPFQEWQAIEERLNRLAAPSNAEGLQCHAGTIRLRTDPLAYQRQCRAEWQGLP